MVPASDRDRTPLLRAPQQRSQAQPRSGGRFQPGASAPGKEMPRRWSPVRGGTIRRVVMCRPWRGSKLFRPFTRGSRPGLESSAPGGAGSPGTFGDVRQAGRAAIAWCPSGTTDRVGLNRPLKLMGAGHHLSAPLAESQAQPRSGGRFQPGASAPGRRFPPPMEPRQGRHTFEDVGGAAPDGAPDHSALSPGAHAPGWNLTPLAGLRRLRFRLTSPTAPWPAAGSCRGDEPHCTDTPSCPVP